MNKEEMLRFFQQALGIALSIRSVQYEIKNVEGELHMGMKTHDGLFRYYSIKITEYGPYEKKI